MQRSEASPFKATARAGSNIAFIKYWGVADPRLNIPLNNSISMTLGALHTTTTVEWDVAGRLSADEITIDGERAAGPKAERVICHLDLIRHLAGDRRFRACVVSRNNFPMASGIASSASAFAALTVAACTAIGLSLDRTRLSAIARRGSGSASRSIFGGYVEWERGNDDATSVARQLFPAEHWALRDVVAVISTAEKAVSSQNGHALALTSPFNAARVDAVYTMLQEVRNAIALRELERLGPLIEQDALAMHAVMMTSRPSLLYWQPGTLEVLHAVRRWREEDGLPVYFTIDAGPNVHLLCEPAFERELLRRLQTLSSVRTVITSGPGGDAEVIDQHLF
ncbi:diphosphomevalonate decarboxylase [Caldilinea sp.]|jgi:diphosphomevalonate decarboxylase|uniref:diphosphomevalonate decarboxylase n=1 Tax=Caldilinea sp. TaxID=2293560 RepID=UPI002636271F|nr:diphosphomevalonate decarboxylase [uncultured Caldilinea sp.]